MVDDLLSLTVVMEELYTVSIGKFITSLSSRDWRQTKNVRLMSIDYSLYFLSGSYDYGICDFFYHSL